MNKRGIVDPKLPGRYGRLTAKELDREVEPFDREFNIDESRPLTPAERARDRRARRKRGRPTVGKGAQRVLVTIERDLLRRCDEYTGRNGLTRAALVAQGLRGILGKAG